MKINWKVRLKSPSFWIGLLGVIGGIIVPYFGLTYADITSWDKIIIMLREFIQNPFLIGSVIMAILGFIGVVTDPTTKSFNDSNRAMTYEKPNKDED